MRQSESPNKQQDFVRTACTLQLPKYLQLTLELEGAKLQLEESAASYQQASSRAGNAEARIQVCCSSACFVTA